MSESDDEAGATSARRPWVTIFLGLGVVAAALFYFIRDPSYAPTGDVFLDAACALGDEAMALHLCEATRQRSAASGDISPIWYDRIASVPEYPGNAGYSDGVNASIDLSVEFEAMDQPIEAAKARLYGALLAMEIGEISGARGQLEDVQTLTQMAEDGDGRTIRHLTGLYLAQISWRLGEFEGGHDEIRAFVSRAINMAPYLQASAARAFAEFIRSEELSEVYEWVIEDYALIREIYQESEDWRRFGIAWYLQGQAEAATGDYRRASLTFTTTAEVFATTGFKELQAETHLRHAELMREYVPSLAASLEREAAKIFTGVGVDPRAAQMDPLNLTLYDPLVDEAQ